MVIDPPSVWVRDHPYPHPKPDDGKRAPCPDCQLRPWAKENKRRKRQGLKPLPQPEGRTNICKQCRADINTEVIGLYGD